MSGFIDIQCNGYAGVDFCGAPVTAQEMEHVYNKLIEAKIRAVFPTVVTDEVPTLVSRIRKLRELIDTNPAWRKIMPAFHVEGPSLSPEDGYKGAHLPQYMIPATPEVFKPIIDAAGGAARVAIITLAPEHDAGLKTTRWLVNQGITVSAGHTNVSYDLLNEAVKQGLSMFTHLGNGCPALMPRHDNIINRAFATPGLTLCMIPDGHHIPFFVLREWLRRTDIKRLLLTTDCMSAAHAPPGVYRIAHWELEVGADRLVHPPGKTHLAGSALTMPEAEVNCLEKLGLNAEETRWLTAGHAAQIFAKKLLN